MESVLAIYSTYFMVFIHKSKYHSPTKKAYLEKTGMGSLRQKLSCFFEKSIWYKMCALA